MKKVLSLCLGLVVTFFITGCSKSIKYDYNGKGLLVSSFDEKNNNRTDTIYDENGRELFVYRYVNGKLINREENKYNEVGSIITKTKFYKKNEILENTKYEYKNGLLCKEEYEVEGFSRITSYEYDANNNLILKNADVTYYHSPDDKIKYEPQKDSKTEYEYDTNNYLITETYYSLSDDGVWLGMEKYEYTYDEQGRNIDTFSYRPNDNYDDFYVDNKHTLEYDSKGNIVKNYGYRLSNGSWEIFTRGEYKYDENNNHIELVNYINDIYDGMRFYSKTIMEYDKDNNMVKKVVYFWNKTHEDFVKDNVTTIRYKYYK